MATNNVLLFIAYIYIFAVRQCCGLRFSTVTLENPTQLTDVISHNCVQSLKDMSANCSSNNLHEVPRVLPPIIQKLILARNPIQVLQNVSFLRYPLLNFLDLDHCEITYIENGTFYQLKHLKVLVLTHAVKISALNGELFRYSFNLQYIDIGFNEFETMPYEMSLIPNLKRLRADYNKLYTVNVTCGENVMDSIDLSKNMIEAILEESFVIDCQTRFLILDNPVKWINPKVIASIPVKSLSLSSYQLSIEVLRWLLVGVSGSVFIQELYLIDIGLVGEHYLPPYLFDPLCNKPLSVLDLQANDFLLKDYIFSNLTYVSALYLTKGGEIHPQYFEGMLGLRNLTLGDEEDFLLFNLRHSTWQVNLTHLELYLQTSIFRGVTLTKEAFKGLDSLTTLTIIDTKAKASSTLHLHLSLPNFQHLYLNVSNGENSVTLDTPQLKVLSCGDKTIGNFNCTVRYLQVAKSLEEICMSHALTVNSTTKFQELYNLTFLDISYNYIEMISPGSFANLSLLEVLDLSANFITTITSESFRGLVALHVLRVQQNQLIHMSGNSLKHLSSLTNLHLDGNNLTSLHRNLFATSNTLATLTLSYNQFVTLNSHTFDPILPTIKTVDMSGNPLVCNCESRWLVDKLGRVLVDTNDTLCSATSASLEPVRGKAITLFVTSRYCPVVMPYFVTIFCILSVSAMSIMVYRNSYLIKYRFYLLKLAILGYVEIQDARNRDDFKYDINIMFVENDEEWARDVFRPQVEETFPEMHRIAFGDNQLILGMHYFDAVYDNVENSFKTVLILSRAAVQDHIFMTKFRIAMNHVTDTQTENMVLVFIEDIPDAELPYLVRLYQTGHGEHLRWEEDEESQEYFWYRLTKMLPVNLKINNLIPPL